jgi:hypothetical protein
MSELSVRGPQARRFACCFSYCSSQLHIGATEDTELVRPAAPFAIGFSANPVELELVSPLDRQPQSVARLAVTYIEKVITLEAIAAVS